MARSQATDVDADAAAARHDLHHLRQRLDDAAPRILGTRYNIAIIKCQLLVSAGGGEDAACGDELPAVEQPAELLVPFVGLFAFDRRDTTRDALHHLFRHRLDGFGDVL